ncbi:MAG: response regulator transcription factor [Bacteroidales bacterium]|nr:response regulator transcription factor [Bacteroidales bacterium]
MRALIVEDEQYASILLERLLEKNYPEIEIAGSIQGVEDCIDFLRNEDVDIIFLDIQLKDGNAFNIFERIDVNSYVIFTTAYDEYAVRAFEERALGYLLKPINEEKFRNMVDRVVALDKRLNFSEQINNLLKSNKNFPVHAKRVKQRFLLRYNDKYTIIDTKDIAYIMAENKCSRIVTFNGDKYFCDDTLDKIIKDIDNEKFYRLNRSYIASLRSIESVERYFHGRLKIKLRPVVTNDEITVSREKVNEFLSWLESVGGGIF